MFVLSLKTTRARLAAVVAVGGLLLAVMIGVSASPRSTAVSGAAATDPAAYLQSLGYEAGPQWTDLREMVIPAKEDAAFAAYNTLAQVAGYDLTPYAGQRVKCYTYALKNYPGAQPAQACVYVYKGRVVAGTMRIAEGEITPLKPLTEQGESNGTTG
ncbi:MAG: DUF4830 domain-containing protein [Clostridia bacterium]|nr:DUF4830 domain-containing protein [Clostridia bacterium]